MTALQYTIRTIPHALDKALRQRAQKENKSLNCVALEALARGLELDAAIAGHSDLDGFIGSWVEEPSFESAIADFGIVDAEVWK